MEKVMLVLILLNMLIGYFAMDLAIALLICGCLLMVLLIPVINFFDERKQMKGKYI